MCRRAAASFHQQMKLLEQIHLQQVIGAVLLDGHDWQRSFPTHRSRRSERCKTGQPMNRNFFSDSLEQESGESVLCASFQDDSWNDVVFATLSSVNGVATCGFAHVHSCHNAKREQKKNTDVPTLHFILVPQWRTLRRAVRCLMNALLMRK